MDYEQAVSWVHGLGRLTPRPGTQGMKALMAALGNPQRRLRFVHVVGTNGKGSAVTMLAAVLKAAGYKTGSNISPYVLDFRERFMIDGVMIDRERLAQVLCQVRLAAESLPYPVITFQAITAAALLYFAEEGCDIVCLEAGVGGEHDSTNIIEDTLVACLMRVGYDHTELLGNTLEEIAQEKCGVFKNGCTVISYPAQEPVVQQVVACCAAAAKSPLVIPDKTMLKVLPRGRLLTIIYKGLVIELPFAGYHQALNACVVVEAAWALRQKGVSIVDENIAKGIAGARFPARVEIIREEPLVLLDGAHNDDSAAVLAETLKSWGLCRVTVVMGVLQDKQAEKMLQMLAPYTGRFFATAPKHVRAMAADALGRAAKRYMTDVHVADDVGDALRAAFKESGESVLVCGSLYLAAQARPLLLQQVNGG